MPVRSGYLGVQEASDLLDILFPAWLRSLVATVSSVGLMLASGFAMLLYRYQVKSFEFWVALSLSRSICEHRIGCCIILSYRISLATLRAILQGFEILKNGECNTSMLRLLAQSR
jgi:hypothetical protein